jgi:hypothetical protein
MPEEREKTSLHRNTGFVVALFNCIILAYLSVAYKIKTD